LPGNQTFARLIDMHAEINQEAFDTAKKRLGDYNLDWPESEASPLVACDRGLRLFLIAYLAELALHNDGGAL
jgi:hypothetical protein